MKNVLILKAGDANPSVRIGLGDYDRWFVRTLGGAGHRFRVVSVNHGEKPPSRASDYDAVMMTGSPLSVTQRAPWMDRAAAYMVDAAEHRVPVLGVCFGHQLLAHAFGARVVRNPKGREIGTIACQITAEGHRDPLFEGVPRRFDIQATHEDIVVDEPGALTLLASNENTRNQAFRAGKYIRAVQFHPEADAATMKALIEARLQKLQVEARERGEDPVQKTRALFARIGPTPVGRRILTNFLEHF